MKKKRRKVSVDRCPGEDCPYCNGEACRLCNLPARANDVVLGTMAACEHDVIDRHEFPVDPEATNVVDLMARLQSSLKSKPKKKP